MPQTHQVQPSGLESAASKEPPHKKAKKTQKDSMNATDATMDENIVFHEHQVFENYTRLLHGILMVDRRERNDEVVKILGKVSRLFEECRGVMPISHLDRINVANIASRGYHSMTISEISDFVDLGYTNIFWDPTSDELESTLNALDFVGNLARIYEHIYKELGSPDTNPVSGELQDLARYVATAFYGLQTYTYDPAHGSANDNDPFAEL